MKWWPNYTSNKALIIIGGFIAIYIFFLLFLLVMIINISNKKVY